MVPNCSSTVWDDGTPGAAGEAAPFQEVSWWPQRRKKRKNRRGGIEDWGGGRGGIGGGGAGASCSDHFNLRWTWGTEATVASAAGPGVAQDQVTTVAPKFNPITPQTPKETPPPHHPSLTRPIICCHGSSWYIHYIRSVWSVLTMFTGFTTRLSVSN